MRLLAQAQPFNKNQFVNFPIAYGARLAKKGKPIPGAAAAATTPTDTDASAEADKASGQRVQPASKKRKKSKTAGTKAPGKNPGAKPKPPTT